MRLSYHPNEPKRLADVYDYYLKGKLEPLNEWSDGVGKGNSGGDDAATCSAGKNLKPNQGVDDPAHSSLAETLRVNPNWSWGGVTPFVFEPGGKLSTPWGVGEWGMVPVKAKGGQRVEAQRGVRQVCWHGARAFV